MSILIIIPARGGSKGIPRKNLRPLHGMPLIYHSINTVKKLSIDVDLFISSDDDEIINIAEKFGAQSIKRDSNLAKDITTLDPVIYDGFFKAQQLLNKKYDYVITLQPTSPLLKTSTLEKAIKKIKDSTEIDTLISVANDTHLTWRIDNDKVIPNYHERVNRQLLPIVFKETGGFLITKAKYVTENSRIGKNVDVFPLNMPESIDIDSFEDFQLCEYYFKRKNILVITNGNKKIGLGHVYNTLSIVNELVNHNIQFFILKEGDLAEEKIEQYNYPFKRQKSEDIIGEILEFTPDLIINDILDTSSLYIKDLKKHGIKIINFEDLGPGAKLADIVVNAIYPEEKKLKNHFFGHKYFVLRDEFYFTKEKLIEKNVNNVLLTFGGVDSNNYTRKVLEAIHPFCMQNQININIVAGMGYENYKTLNEFKNITVFKNIKNISDHILNADIIFTSAGRTTFEIAAIGIPAIVMAQNDRETTHLFASEKYGFKYLGLGTNCSINEILSTFQQLYIDFDLRKSMHKKMLKCGIKEGKNRTIKIIKNLIDEM